MRKEIFIKILFATIVLLISLWVTDLYIRSHYPLPQKGYGVWAGYPDCSNKMMMSPDNFSAIHRYNSFGFRGINFSITPTTSRRIACVGDSFTEGYGAHEDKSWPSVLRAKLANQDVDVLNLGKAGTQSDVYANIINKVAIPLKPTDIIVCMITSDFRYGFELPHDLSVRREFNNPFIDNRIPIMKPLVKIFPGWVYMVDRMRGRYPISSTTCWPIMSDKVIFKKALAGIPIWNHISYMASREVFAKRKKRVNPEVLTAVEHGGFNPYLLETDLVQAYYTYRATVSDMSISKDDLQNCTDEWMKWYSELCKANNIRAWILYFPLPPLVSKGAYGIYEDSFYTNAPDVYGDTSVRDVLAESCLKYEVNLIDPTDAFIKNNGKKLFHRWDTHPTEKGYELIGNTVSEKISSNL